MSISLAKGQGISLAKKDGGSLRNIKLGVGWDAARAKSGGGLMSRLFGGGSGGSTGSIDLDASCVMFDAANRQRDEVWFGKPGMRSNCGSVTHSGDNLTGDGEGDDETISVDLSRVPQEIDTLVFTVQSFRGQTFNEVENAYARLLDDKGVEVARYTISDSGDHTGVIMAKVSRRTGEWRIEAIGVPANGRTIHDIARDIQRVL